MLNRTARLVTGLELEGLGFFPSEVLVGEMAVLCRLAVDWVCKVKLLHDDAWPQIEICPDDIHQFI